MSDGERGLPRDVEARVRSALEGLHGRDVRVEHTRPAPGGCIHNALSVETSAGTVFLKWNRGGAGAGFESEARGLEHLRSAAAGEGLLAVPAVLGVEDAEGDAPGWLLLEYLPPTSAGNGYARQLGVGLAALHAAGHARNGDLRAAPGDDSGVRDSDGGRDGQGEVPSFGWFEDNRIGRLPQQNPWTGAWAAFWRDARLRPQIEAAAAEGHLDPGADRWAERILDAVAPAVKGAEPAGPELVHGDLWSGNVHPGAGGRPVLVDPATYLGAGEVDLAMARLFGGFGEEFYQAYAEAAAQPPGFEEVRLPLYQLYYLLVHVRLFGASYLPRTREAAERVLAATGC